MQLRELTYEEFVAAGLSRTTARFLTARNHPIPHFHILVRAVNSRWSYWIPEGATDVIGLWDENGDPFCRWFRNGALEYVQLYHDEPTFHVVAKSEQGLLAYLFEQFYEFVDWRDESRAHSEVIAFGNYIGFIGMNALLVLLENYAQTNDDGQYERGRAELLKSL